MTCENERLRAHVTRVGFDLSLGRTHIAALVLVAEGWAKNRYINTAGTGRNLWSWFVPGVRGCEDRGLTWHNDPGPVGDKKPPNQIYGLTPAGKLVVALLKEAGIYDEYVDALPQRKAS